MKTSRRHFLHTSLAGTASLAAMPTARAKQQPPNFLFILTDDQRHSALGCAGNPLISTPALDSLAAQGAHFKNAFVTTSICSPSRACCLTGRYGSANGVVTFGNPKLNPNETTFAHVLKQAGYKTGMVGKWHLGNTPQECGFDYAAYFKSNGSYYNRKINEHGEQKTAEGYIEEYNTKMSTRFLRESKQAGQPFALFHCTQIPHMNHAFEWVAKEETKKQYPINKMPLPKTWQDDLAGKPPYLKTGRNRQQALKYGYDKAHNIRAHFRDYYAAITEMDATLGTLLKKLDDLGMWDNTYIIFMGDNGWFMGEHGFTSKVLPYEESIRVPMILAGPGIQHQTDHHLVLNADLAP
ncbi:sulfatase-like hydrolase/transferase, partial [bacterium]|nr:sulfatase-like hydrolase/transferase [bacterium]